MQVRLIFKVKFRKELKNSSKENLLVPSKGTRFCNALCKVDLFTSKKICIRWERFPRKAKSHPELLTQNFPHYCFWWRWESVQMLWDFNFVFLSSRHLIKSEALENNKSLTLFAIGATESQRQTPGRRWWKARGLRRRARGTKTTCKQSEWLVRVIKFERSMSSARGAASDKEHATVRVGPAIMQPQ